MDYFRIYDSLITRAKNRVIPNGSYYEEHHIIPKCMGGSDTKCNLVSLYPEEHYIAHQLLVKMYPQNPLLVSAAIMMTVHSSTNSYRVNNKLYGWLRRKHSKAMSEKQTGENNNQHGTFWITDGTSSKKIKTTDDIPDGWYKGRVLPQLRKNIVKTCRVCNIIITKKRGSLCDTHFKEARTEVGKRHYKNIKNVYQNKIFITDGKTDKLHLASDPIPEGFRRGRTNNKHLNKK